MSGLTDSEKEILTRLTAEHEDVAAFRARSGDLIVVRKCKSAERARFIDKASDKDRKLGTISATLKELTLSCVVHPAPEEARGLLERYPALYDKLANKAYELAGADVEELGKDWRPRASDPRRERSRCSRTAAAMTPTTRSSER